MWDVCVCESREFVSFDVGWTSGLLPGCILGVNENPGFNNTVLCCTCRTAVVSNWIELRSVGRCNVFFFSAVFNISWAWYRAVLYRGVCCCFTELSELCTRRARCCTGISAQTELGAVQWLLHAQSSAPLRAVCLRLRQIPEGISRSCC